MERGRLLRCAALLVAVTVALLVPAVDGEAYDGWPAPGLAAALLLLAGPRSRWPVLLVLTLVAALALSYSFGVGLLQGLFGSFTVVLPALLTQHLLSRDGQRLDLDGAGLGGANSVRYHAVTALASFLSGVLATVGVALTLESANPLTSGVIAFLATLTAQLTVLPLLIRTRQRPPPARRSELAVQRTLLVVVTLSVFVPSTDLPVAFLVLPVLGWAAIRASRTEAHVQLFAVCVTTYALTFAGHGPLAGPLPGLSADLETTLPYLFMAAACYLTVPLALTVERLVAVTTEATHAATTVERLLDAVSGTVIFATDSELNFTHWNAGAEELLGYGRDEVNQLAPDVFHTQEEIARHARHFGVRAEHDRVMRAMIETGERRDWQFIHRDGTPRMTSLRLSRVVDADGQLIGFIGAGEDVADRLRVQDALLTALDREHASVLRLEEVDHVKQELVSNVSHELRTPITSISGYAELLAEGELGHLNETQSDAVERIERNTRRLEALVEDLLTLSRAESGKLDLKRSDVDLREVVREAHELLLEVLKVRALDVRLDLPADPVLVHGDPQALERVAVNLLSNAVKFTADGGRVRCVVRRDADHAVLEVGDTGMGIPLADQEQLFTRFFRSSNATQHAIQGTGLGLSIVHSIVTVHGGTVTVDSAPGIGTTFTVSLPCAGAQAPAPGDAAGPSSPAG